MSRLDKYFKLTIEDTENVIKTFIKPKCNYNIRKSPISNSIYIIFYGSVGEKIVRLSDHEAGHLEYNYIGKSTRVKKVVAIIEKALKDLNTLCVHRKLSECKLSNNNVLSNK